MQNGRVVALPFCIVVVVVIVVVVPACG